MPTLARFVRNFGGVFAILFEVHLIGIQEEIHHFAGWEAGLRGAKIVHKHFVNKLAFPKNLSRNLIEGREILSQIL